MNKRLITTTALLTILSTGLTAAPVTYDFTLDDWNDGGSLTGSFTADDIDDDGQIVSFKGEVLAFSAVYSNEIGSTSFDIDDLGADFGPLFIEDEIEDSISGPTSGLVFNLDGLGTIGDSNAGAGEGLLLNNGATILAVGAFEGQCNSDGAPCGFVDSFFGEFAEIVVVEGGTEPLFIVDDDFNFFSATAFSPILVTTEDEAGLGVTPSTEDTALLEDGQDDDGGFIFNIPVWIPDNEFFFIDPVVAVGYTYEVENSTFAGVKAPSLGAVNDGEYTLTYTIGGVEFVETLLAGEEHEFDAADNVTSFTLTDIDPDLGLDPSVSTVFITGISLFGINGSTTVTQTPITFDTDLNAVPLPASSLLLLAGIGGLVSLRRRKAA